MLARDVSDAPSGYLPGSSGREPIYKNPTSNHTPTAGEGAAGRWRVSVSEGCNGLDRVQADPRHPPRRKVAADPRVRVAPSCGAPCSFKGFQEGRDDSEGPRDAPLPRFRLLGGEEVGHGHRTRSGLAGEPLPHPEDRFAQERLPEKRPPPGGGPPPALPLMLPHRPPPRPR